jgi:hypothetical protein
VTFSTECETKDGYDCGVISGTTPAIPMADLLDNAAKFNKVLDAASRYQEKGGPYTLEMNEIRVCDGGAPVRAQGVEVRGLTLTGLNAVTREALKQGEFVLRRYEQRAAKGDKTEWDHTKAKKVKRNDLGQRVK